MSVEELTEVANSLCDRVWFGSAGPQANKDLKKWLVPEIVGLALAAQAGDINHLSHMVRHAAVGNTIEVDAVMGILKERITEISEVLPHVT